MSEFEKLEIRAVVALSKCTRTDSFNGEAIALSVELKKFAQASDDDATAQRAIELRAELRNLGK